MSNRAAILKEVATPLIVEPTQVPKVEPSEVLVRNHAIAINPADWKMRDYGVFVENYPVILGSDVAGIVETVGSAVSSFKEGDRVAGLADILVSKDSRNGAFQEYTAVKESGLTKIPSKISFEEASLLPMAVATVGMGLFVDLGIPEYPSKQTGGFLVWGASSAVGSTAVQLAKVLGFTVFAVCSVRHHDYVRHLGASSCVDYHDPSVADMIIDAAKSSGHNINIGYDAISENGSSPLAARILDAFGGGKLCTTLPYPNDQEKPASVQTFHTFALRLVQDQKELGSWLFGTFLSNLLSEGAFTPSPAIQRVDGGLEAVQAALDLLKEGISGKKLVLSL